MPDTTSRYRQFRVSIYLPPPGLTQARWAALAIGVIGGVPRSHIVDDGVAGFDPSRPVVEASLLSLEQVLNAITLR